MHHLMDDPLRSSPPLVHEDCLPVPRQDVIPKSTFSLFPHLPTELRLQIWKATLPRARILKIHFSPLHNHYIPEIDPPITLSVSCEARSLALQSYVYLHLGSSGARTSPEARRKAPLIPYSPETDTLYISDLAPILTTHLPQLLYDLSTSPTRHLLRSLAVDLRVWNECCEAGLLGTLGGLKGLRKVSIVVEFGREFGGEVGFLECPEWRRDLRGLAERAGKVFGETRCKRLGVRHETEGTEVGVEVGCVLLTRGGEQA